MFTRIVVRILIGYGGPHSGYNNPTHPVPPGPTANSTPPSPVHHFSKPTTFPPPYTNGWILCDLTVTHIVYYSSL